MKSENRDAKLIFGEALRLNVPAERAAYLAQACTEDLELRQEVESLLSAHAQAGDFLDLTRSLPASDFLIERTGTMIGRYKLLQKIGEGGFGVVYMAEQVEPVQRKVALKIIKAGMDTKEVIARFEAERQALALMDHPGIANILDAGATDAGRPYFVMELVNGIPITDYCDRKKLPTAERLRLFMKVCHAVQHAHQKGIIHRDLKPSNVLVTLHDGEPVPKVIDFGVVKALGQKLTRKTLFTGFQHLVGTPAYMSPEQAELSGLDVDTRSDIYSLGVLLYELLTGMTPFDKETLAKAAFDEMRRMIRETDPPKPSTRLNTLSQDDLGTVAAKRQAEPTKLNRLVRGDLDWIVMKCMEKDRGRRYETANNVAVDIEHQLQHEPVSGAAPSTLYLAQKFVRRHQAGLAVAAAFALLLAAGAVTSTWQALRATRAEREQARLRQQAQTARLRAEADEKKAETEAIRSTQVAQFLKEMLRSVEPAAALGQDTKLLRGILDRAAERVGKDLTNQPLVEAELKLTIGTAYRDIGFPAEAEAMTRDALRLCRAALGETNVLTAHCLINLGSILNRWGGPPHAQEVEELLRQAVALQKAIPDPDEEAVIDGIDFLSRAIRGQKDKRQEAEALTREVLARRIKLFGSEHMSVGKSLNNLGNVLSMQGKLEEAETSIRRAIAILRKILGEGGPELCWSLRCLAITLQNAGRLPEAEAAYREGLEMARTVNGEDSIYTDAAFSRLARLLRQQGKQAELETLSRETVERRRRLLGDQHPRLASSLADWADTLLAGNKFTEAEAPARECLVIQEKTLPDDWLTFSARSRLGDSLLGQKKYAEAEPFLLSGYQGMIHREEKIPEASKLRLNEALRQLVELLRRRGKLAEANATAHEAAQECHTVMAQYEKLVADPNRHRECWSFAISYEEIGGVLKEIGQTQEAEQAYQDTQVLWRKLVANFNTEDHRFHLGANYEALGDLLKQAGRATESLESYRAAQAIWLKLVAEFNMEDRRNHLGWTEDYIGQLLQEAGLLDEATEAYRQALAVWKNLVVDFSKDAYRNHVSGTLVSLARMLQTAGKRTEAGPIFREAAEHADVQTLNELAWQLATSPDPKLRDGPSAVTLAEKAVAGANRTNPMIMDTLAAAYAETGQFTNAVRVQQEAIALLQNEQQKKDYASRLKLYESGIPCRNPALLAQQSTALLANGKFAEAEPLARECLAIRENQNSDDWLTFNARSLLGGSLLGQKKHAEAEPLLLAAYEGMKQREARIPANGRPHLKETLQRLVKLYDATDRPDQAAEWKQKLADFEKAGTDR